MLFCLLTSGTSQPRLIPRGYDILDIMTHWACNGLPPTSSKMLKGQVPEQNGKFCHSCSPSMRPHATWKITMDIRSQWSKHRKLRVLNPAANTLWEAFGNFHMANWETPQQMEVARYWMGKTWKNISTNRRSSIAVFDLITGGYSPIHPINRRLFHVEDPGGASAHAGYQIWTIFEPIEEEGPVKPCCGRCSLPMSMV